MAAILGRDGVVGMAAYHLRRQPVLLFALVALAIVAVVAVVAAPAANDTAPIVRWLVGFAAFAIGVFALLTLLKPQRRPEVVALAPIQSVKPPPFPPVTDDDDADELAQTMYGWLQSYFNSAEIVVGAGTSRGVRRGDQMVVLDEPGRAKGLHADDVAALADTKGSTLRVVQAFREESVCRLDDFSYKHFLDVELPRAVDAVVAQHGAIDTELLPELLSPFHVGQWALLIPHEERVAHDAIEENYARAIEDGIDESERNVHYREVVREADRYLLDFGHGFYAPAALFQRGFAEFKLKRLENAEDTFASFLERYPFHVSASGAREWLEKARAARVELN